MLVFKYIKLMNDKKINKFIKYLLFFTILLTFFILGAYSSDKIEDLYVKKAPQIEKKFELSGNIFDKKDLNLEKFWKVYDIVKNNYY